MDASLPTSDDVLRALRDFADPETGRDVVTMEQVAGVALEGETLRVELRLTSWARPIWEESRKACAALLSDRFAALKNVRVELAEHIRPPARLGTIGLTAKSVIAVASGKGGVGKSTVAALLAYGLQKTGCRVGLMDADVYGPSIPHLLGVNRRPEIVDGKIEPIECQGVNVISMGFLVPPGEAVVWRGPMLHGAITQFLRDTRWGDLDYLVIDMPPGTGDIALTLSQLLPLTGSVVVCTPQEVALIDAVKAIAMFRKVNIPILGVVENMSSFVCPDCHKRYDIFGSGGAKRMAVELDIPFLGDAPINIQLRIRGDEGRIVDNLADEACGPYFEKIAQNLVRNLAHERAASPPAPSLPVLG